MTRRHSSLATTLVALTVTIGVAGTVPDRALAQAAGKVAAAEETAEIGRNGAWTAASPGQAVVMGDTLRTSGTGRLKIALDDGSVLVVSEDTTLVVNEYVYDANAGTASSIFDLLQGKVRAIVSEYYEETASKFEMTTGTAVAGVRGTDFIVTYDDIAEVTEVVGISGRVYVRSLSLATGPVLVTAQTQTTVERGRSPSEPRPLEDERFRHYLDGVDFVGGRQPASLGFNQPVLAGDAVPLPERAGATGAAEASLDLDHIREDSGKTNASSLAQQPPTAIEAGDLGIRF